MLVSGRVNCYLNCCKLPYLAVLKWHPFPQFEENDLSGRSAINQDEATTSLANYIGAKGTPWKFHSKFVPEKLPVPKRKPHRLPVRSIQGAFAVTLPETNSKFAPENGWFESFLLGRLGLFSGAFAVSFGGCKLWGFKISERTPWICF